jgi:hypothetical protein
LSHVYPFKFDYVLPASEEFVERTVGIQVSFTSHAFTRTCEMDETPQPEYCSHGEARVFDHERYRFSKLLPDVFRNIGKRKRSPGGRMAKKVTFRALVSKVLAGGKPKPPP